MFSFRPTAEQWERLRAGRAPVSLVIHSAVVRWRRGDFVLQNIEKKEKHRFVTQNVVVRESFPDVRDGAHMRRILDAHFNTPNAGIEKELAKAEAQEAELMRSLTGVPFILEEEKP